MLKYESRTQRGTQSQCAHQDRQICHQRAFSQNEMLHMSATPRHRNDSVIRQMSTSVQHQPLQARTGLTDGHNRVVGDLRKGTRAMGCSGVAVGYSSTAQLLVYTRTLHCVLGGAGRELLVQGGGERSSAAGRGKPVLELRLNPEPGAVVRSHGQGPSRPFGRVHSTAVDPIQCICSN